MVHFMYQLPTEQILINEMKQNRLLTKRQVYINDYVTEDSMFIAREQLLKIVEKDEFEGITPDKAEPISIMCSSYGGSIDAGLSFISLCTRLKKKGYILKTIVYSVGMSMGSLIPIVCGTKGERYCEKYSRYLLHTPRFAEFYRDILTTTEINSLAKDMNETWGLMKKLYKEYSSISEKKLNEIYKTNDDCIFWANEAIKLNLVDKILE